MGDYAGLYDAALDDSTVNQFISAVGYEVPDNLKSAVGEIGNRKFGKAKETIKNINSNATSLTEDQNKSLKVQGTVKVIEDYHLNGNLNEKIQKKVAKKKLEKILQAA